MNRSDTLPRPLHKQVTEQVSKSVHTAVLNCHGGTAVVVTVSFLKADAPSGDWLCKTEMATWWLRECIVSSLMSLLATIRRSLNHGTSNLKHSSVWTAWQKVCRVAHIHSCVCTGIHCFQTNGTRLQEPCIGHTPTQTAPDSQILNLSTVSSHHTCWLWFIWGKFWRFSDSRMIALVGP